MSCFAPIVGGLAHRLPRKPLLIALDIVRAAIVLAMPFVTAIWQIYVLIFLLNLFSAGFKPVFQATIPDLLPDEQQYTRALSYSRLAYDLENLLSPTFAGLALLVFSYDALFQVNSIAFLVSAVLIFGTALPATQRVDRLGGVWGEISFGVRSYMRTPRLRALLILYLGVAGASAMVIVNTVVYVREYLGGSETDTALAFAAAGGGSMIAALLLPKILDRIPDRPVMLAGGVLMGFGLLAIYSRPVFAWILPIWCLIGMGWSLVQDAGGTGCQPIIIGSRSPGLFLGAICAVPWLLVVGLSDRGSTRSTYRHRDGGTDFRRRSLIVYDHRGPCLA